MTNETQNTTRATGFGCRQPQKTSRQSAPIQFAPAGVRDETYAEKIAMKRAGGDATLLRR